MFYEKPPSGDRAQCLDYRVNSSQVVQEGYSKEVPFEGHLSDVTTGQGGDPGAERSGKSRTTPAKALRWDCTWPWDSKSTPGRSRVSRAERRRRGAGRPAGPVREGLLGCCKVHFIGRTLGSIFLFSSR